MAMSKPVVYAMERWTEYARMFSSSQWNQSEQMSTRSLKMSYKGDNISSSG